MEALLDLLTLAPRSKSQAVLVFPEQGFITTVFPGENVEVEQWPADVIKGKNPQLEEAIRIVVEELKQNPTEKPVRPPYPFRVRK